MINKELLLFDFKGEHVRVIKDEQGELWFIANDIAEFLGYAHQKMAVQAHCKRAKLLKGSESYNLGLAPRGVNLIPESDVYMLIMRSHLPAAKKFQRWVTHEVLPTIRKTGSYSLGGVQQAPPKTYAEALLLAAKIAREKEDHEAVRWNTSIPRSERRSIAVQVLEEEHALEMENDRVRALL